MIPVTQPELLLPDNFTPPQRTPWGGRKLIELYKRGLELRAPASSYAVVGESWEISVDPTFPSIVRSTGSPLSELIAESPTRWLGERTGTTELPLLVKWIDTADALSVQVHPPEDFAGLRTGESGKWEAWYIVHAEPGAGVYLGFRTGVSRDEVQRCAEGDGRLDALLNFVEVHPGDLFVIEPGTPHALGAGVTLLEPQLVNPGKTGVTYRFWDWNRRYDAHGQPSTSGSPRPLHLDQSLGVTRWDIVCDDSFADSCRRTPRPLAGDGGLTRNVMIETRELIVERWQGSGSLNWSSEGAFHAATCIAGEMTFTSAVGKLDLRRGESAAIPAAAGAASVAARDAELVLVRRLA